MSFTIDAENGMWICACGGEANDTGKCDTCDEKVYCHHCDKMTEMQGYIIEMTATQGRIDSSNECQHCGMYVDLVVIKGKMVKRYVKKGLKMIDRVALHEKS